MPSQERIAAVIRPARPADAAQMAQVHVRSLRATYPGIVPQDALDALSEEESAGRFRQRLESPEPGDGPRLVAEVGGCIVGQVHLGGRAENAEETRVGGLNSIYLDPDWWRRGIGRQLWDACVELAREEGWRWLRVRTAAANTGASRFYEAMGCTLMPGSEGTMQYLGGTVTTVRYVLEL